MDGLELSSQVSTKEPYFYGSPMRRYKVAAVDFGIKKNTLRNFDERDLPMYRFSRLKLHLKKWKNGVQMHTLSQMAPVILQQCLMPLKW
jgi:hypothetical protein